MIRDDTVRRSPHIAIFPLIVGLLYAVVALSLAISPAGAAGDYLVSAAVPFDLMVSVPALAYFLVLRRRGISPLFALPLVWAGAAVSALVVPIGQQQILAILLTLAVALDVAVIGREALRAGRAFRQARAASTDPVNWFAATLQAFLPNKRVARLGGMEAATLYYALASWRAQPDQPEDTHAFTYCKNSGYGAMVGGLMLALPAEVIVVHLLIAQFSPTAATVVTALSLYSMLWLIGDWRASALRPVLVSSRELTVRFGVRYTARIPIDAIADLTRTAPAISKQEVLNLAAMGGAPLWVMLARPIPVEGLLGTTRLVTAATLTLDAPDAFMRTVSEMRGRH